MELISLSHKSERGSHVGARVDDAARGLPLLKVVVPLVVVLAVADAVAAVDERLLFSLITEGRTVDLQAESEAERNELVRGFNALIAERSTSWSAIAF